MLAPEFPSVTSLGPGYAVGKKAKKGQKKSASAPSQSTAWLASLTNFFLCFCFCFYSVGAGGGGGGGGGGLGGGRENYCFKMAVEFLSCEQTGLFSAASNDNTLKAKLVICLEGLMSRGFD